MGILPANTRYRLVGKVYPHLVKNGGKWKEQGRAAALKECVQEDILSRADPSKQFGLNYK